MTVFSENSETAGWRRHKEIDKLAQIARERGVQALKRYHGDTAERLYNAWKDAAAIGLCTPILLPPRHRTTATHFHVRWWKTFARLDGKPVVRCSVIGFRNCGNRSRGREIQHLKEAIIRAESEDEGKEKIFAAYEVRPNKIDFESVEQTEKTFLPLP